MYVYFVGFLGLVSNTDLISHIKQDSLEFPLEYTVPAFVSHETSILTRLQAPPGQGFFTCSFTDISPSLAQNLAHGTGSIDIAERMILDYPVTNSC